MNFVLTLLFPGLGLNNEFKIGTFESA